MDNIERNDFFPTCVYKFQHEFVENELEKMGEETSFFTFGQTFLKIKKI